MKNEYPHLDNDFNHSVIEALNTLCKIESVFDRPFKNICDALAIDEIIDNMKLEKSDHEHVIGIINSIGAKNVMVIDMLRRNELAR